MKISGALLLSLLFLATGYSQTSSKPHEHADAVFISFHRSLRDLANRFSKKSSRGIEEKIAQSLQRISDNVEFLEAAIKLEATMPPEYAEAVSLDAELLKQLASRKTRNARELRSLYDGLNEVDSDLTLKVTGPRSGGEIARVVEVFVRARKGNQDVGAYQVWYVPKGWAKDATKFKPFDRLTDPASPSSMKLAPGNYLIWLGKNRITEPQPVTIGANGETRREIEVPLP